MNNNTEIDLSKSKQLLTVLMDLIPGIVYVYNQKGEKIYWNKKTEDIIGRMNDKIEDFNEIDLLFSDNQKKTIINKAFEDGIFNAVTEVTTHNGETKTFSHVGIITKINKKKYLIGTGIDITEKEMLESQQRVNQFKIIKLITKIGLVEELERKKIAQILHDKIGQELSILYMQLTRESSHKTETSTQHNEIIASIKHCIDSLRSITFELTPPMLDNQEIILCLNHIVEYFDYKYHKTIHISVNDLKITALEKEKNHIMHFGIIELLMNAHKYAGTDEMWVNIVSNDEMLKISVIDKGAGFIPEQIDYTKTFGIFNLKDRIILTGGEFNIKSSPGKGTIIDFSLPI